MPTGFAVVGAISASWGFMKGIVSYLKGIKGAKKEITDVLLRFENNFQLLSTLHQFFTEERLQHLDEDSLGHLTRVFSYLLPITQDAYAKVLKYDSISLGDKIKWATWGKDLKSSEKRVFQWIERLRTCFIWLPAQMKQQLLVAEGAPSALSQIRVVAVQQEMERKVARLRETETRQIKATNGNFKLPDEQARSIAMTSRTQIVEVNSVRRLVEYRRIPVSMAGDVAYQEETDSEAMKLVSLLSSVVPAEMFVLRTAFYFETFDRDGRPVPSIPFGIGYDLPDGFATPTQLSALWATKEGERPRHSLNERFELAR